MERTVEEISQNLDDVINKIKSASERVNRNYAEIKLVVVTKSQSLETTRNAVIAGAKILGENYAEEGIEKKGVLEHIDNIQWHMIGHVQSRKAKLVASDFDMVHSLDSLKLAKRLDNFSREFNKVLPVLLEFNVGGEQNKYGWDSSNVNSWSDFLPIISEISDLKNLNICGIMTMPPYSGNPEDSRQYFKRLIQLREYINDRIPSLKLVEISMGTSTDFEIAVEEGATILRIGEAILGKREYKGAL